MAAKPVFFRNGSRCLLFNGLDGHIAMRDDLVHAFPVRDHNFVATRNRKRMQLHSVSPIIDGHITAQNFTYRQVAIIIPFSPRLTTIEGGRC
jgi:hypothetical protein